MRYTPPLRLDRYKHLNTIRLKSVSFLLSLFIIIVFLSPPAETLCDQLNTEQAKGTFFASAVISESEYILVGERGRIFLSSNSAKTWHAVPSRTGSALASVCFPDNKNGWSVGQNGVILHSSDSGKTWALQASGINKYLLAVDFFDADNGFAVGANSAVLSTNDRGKTWKESLFRMPSEFEDDPEFAEEYNLFAVIMIDAQNICIAGNGGRIFITTDAGKTWIDVKSPLYDEEMMEGRTLYSMTYDSGILYAVGIDCTFVYSNDRGKTWISGNIGYTEPDLFSIDVAGGTGIAAGSGGNIFKTTDSGKTWRRLTTPEKIVKCWLSGTDLKKTGRNNITGIIAGQNGSVGLLKNGNIKWQ